jgi:hypothetical protein
MRRVAWRSWAVLAAALAAYAALGWLWSSNGTVEAWLYRIGLTAAAILPVVFTAVYTATGARWWANKIGSALVLAALSVVPTTAPLAYVFWWNGGRLTSSWLAWLAVSGPALAALALGRMCWVWAALYRAGKLPQNGSDSGKHEVPR